VREFHVDGLRLDAVHAVTDTSAVHILSELTAAVREEAMALGRPVHVIAESHDNDRRLILAAPHGFGLDAVWSDDFHHALHARLTGEGVGYYADFPGGRGLERALAEGFAFQGEPSAYWGWPRGTPSADLEGDRFVIAVQNHDQVGNRPGSQRLVELLGPEAVKVAAALLFAAAAIPLLFMGEEYGEPAPFPFFTSFLDPALNAAVRRGRQREFERFGWPPAIDHPGDPLTFERARLRHALAEAPGHRELRAYYRAWLALRRAHPALGTTGKARTRVESLDGVLTLTRQAATGERVVLVANLTPAPRALPPLSPGARVLLDSADRRFGGAGGAPLSPHHALLFEVDASQ
jgi:maltooligosyltrehalose trehalohydrolase